MLAAAADWGASISHSPSHDVDGNDDDDDALLFSDSQWSTWFSGVVIGYAITAGQWSCVLRSPLR